MTVFPFFVGCERSGTTLLRLMVDSHPEIAIPGESYFVARFAWRRARYEQGGSFDQEAFLADLFEHAWFPKWGMPEDQVRQAFAASTVVDVPDAVRRVFATYAAAQGKARYGDKTPDYIRQIPILSATFPESRFVHVIRDGRDVALSLVDVGLADDLTHAALRWKSQIRIGRLAAERLSEDRYLEVRYEDLVDSPEPVLRRICDFIGLVFDDAMLRHTERAPAIVAAMNDDRHVHAAQPVTVGLRDWHIQMNERDLAVTELLLGDTLTTLGYATSGTRPGLAAQVEAKRILAGDAARRARARLRPS